MTQQDIEKACSALREILYVKDMINVAVIIDNPYIPSRYKMVVAKKGQTVEEVVGIFKDILTQ